MAVFMPSDQDSFTGALALCAAPSQTMVSMREVVVGLENGLHLAPSSQVVQLTKNFGCEVRIRKGDRIVDAGSMLDLLTLAAEQGSTLILEARGDRAEEVVAALARLLESKTEPAGHDPASHA